MATAATATRDKVEEYTFLWEGKDKGGKLVRGDIVPAAHMWACSELPGQGIAVLKVKRKRGGVGGKVTQKDITLFTRQLATMMKAGVPLLQSFDIVGKGHSNPAVGKLLMDIKNEVETGNSLNVAFREYPLHFDALYCNLVGAGEQAGILGQPAGSPGYLQGENPCDKEQDQGGAVLSDFDHRGGFHHHSDHHDFRDSGIQGAVFQFWRQSSGTDTLCDGDLGLLCRIGGGRFSGGVGFGVWFFFYTWKRSVKMQQILDKWFLKISVFGPLIRKATIARWTRTLSTMFAAGVPLVEALDSVAGAAGNFVYYEATKKIQQEVSAGISLTIAMTNTKVCSRTWLSRCVHCGRIRIAGRNAGQGCRSRAGSRRRCGSTFQFDGADDHGRAGRVDRWNGHRNVPPAYLQDGSSGIICFPNI